MKDKTKIIFKSKEWFEENAYKDSDGDYFRSEEDLNDFEKTGHANTAYILSGFIEKQEIYLDETSFSIDKLAWAIEVIATSTTHPEYFL